MGQKVAALQLGDVPTKNYRDLQTIKKDTQHPQRIDRHEFAVKIDFSSGKELVACHCMKQ